MPVTVDRFDRVRSGRQGVPESMRRRLTALWRLVRLYCACAQPTAPADAIAGAVAAGPPHPAHVAIGADPAKAAPGAASASTGLPAGTLVELDIAEPLNPAATRPAMRSHCGWPNRRASATRCRCPPASAKSSMPPARAAAASRGERLLAALSRRGRAAHRLARAEVRQCRPDQDRRGHRRLDAGRAVRHVGARRRVRHPRRRPRARQARARLNAQQLNLQGAPASAHTTAACRYGRSITTGVIPMHSSLCRPLLLALRAAFHASAQTERTTREAVAQVVASEGDQTVAVEATATVSESAAKSEPASKKADGKKADKTAAIGEPPAGRARSCSSARPSSPAARSATRCAKAPPSWTS